MKSGKQTTLRERASLVGTGVHTNASVRIVLHPSDANSGIVFLRTGLPGYRDRLIEAKWSKVSMTELCTVIGEPSDATVATVEHLLAALCGLGVDNVLVSRRTRSSDHGRIGSRFRRGNRSGGRRSARAPPLRQDPEAGPRQEARLSELCPAERGFRLDVEIDFDARVIGRQKKVIDLNPDSFRRDLSRARTFGFVHGVGIVEEGLCPRFLSSKIRSRSTVSASSIRRARVTATSSSATRRSTRSGIWRSPGRRSSAATAPSAADTK